MLNISIRGFFMPIFIALALLLLNNFVLFSASAASSELAEDPSQVPVPVYRISGTTSTGLVVNGVVVFSCHSTPSHCYMQQIGEFVHQATHFIVESDPYFVEGFHTTSHTTKYHEDSEFIRLGIYCEHDNTGSLLEHFKETDSPCKVLLEQYPRKNTLYTTFNRLWRNILGGFSYDNGIDTWAYESGKKHTLFCLEDMCDQAQSEEEELQMDHEMFKVLNFEQWKDLLIKTYDFIESPGYLYYKIIISNFVKGQGDKPFEFPGLVQSIEGEFFCRWTTQPITPTRSGSLNMNRSKRIDVTFLPVKQV